MMNISQPTTRNKTNKKDVKLSSTFNILLQILIDDAISNLPAEAYKEVDTNFLFNLYFALLEMRSTGYSYIYVDEYASGEYNYITKGVYTYGKDFNKSLRVDSNGTTYELSRENFIEFGSKTNPELHIMAPLKSQLWDIANYENSLESLQLRDEISTLWFVKSSDYDDYIDSGSTSVARKIKEKIRNLVYRNEKSIALLGKEDEVANVQANINDVLVNKQQEKVALAFKVPYSRIFKGVSSGFNTLDQQDIKIWNNQIRRFQLVYIMPALKQFLKITNKKDNLETLTIESIDDEDKELKATIEQMKFNQITTAFSLGLIEEDKAKELTNNLLTGGK